MSLVFNYEVVVSVSQINEKAKIPVQYQLLWCKFWQAIGLYACTPEVSVDIPTRNTVSNGICVPSCHPLPLSCDFPARFGISPREVGIEFSAVNEEEDERRDSGIQKPDCKIRDLHHEVTAYCTKLDQSPLILLLQNKCNVINCAHLHFLGKRGNSMLYQINSLQFVHMHTGACNGEEVLRYNCGCNETTKQEFLALTEVNVL